MSEIKATVGRVEEVVGRVETKVDAINENLVQQIGSLSEKLDVHLNQGGSAPVDADRPATELLILHRAIYILWGSSNHDFT